MQGEHYKSMAIGKVAHFLVHKGTLHQLICKQKKLLMIF